MSDVLLVDRPLGPVVRLLINRPAKRNAIDHDVRQALTDALIAVEGDASIRSIVIGGVGGLFSAGGDLPSMAGLDEARARARMEHIHRLCRLIAAAPVPVVVAIEGVAAGGAVGMALLADHIVMARNARILFPFLSLGLTPDWAQLLTLPRRVGLPRARRILSSTAPVLADEAHAIGLIDTLVDASQAMQTALDEAIRLAMLPADAFVRTRQRLNGPQHALQEELLREQDDQARCLTGAEFREGFGAFAERRTPDFAKVLRNV